MNDRLTVRMVIGSLALLAFTVVVGGIYLTAIDKSLPGELIAMGSAAAGAVGGILSKTGHNEPQPVVGPGGGPVPVIDEAGRVQVDTLILLASLVVLVLFAVSLAPFEIHID